MTRGQSDADLNAAVSKPLAVLTGLGAVFCYVMGAAVILAAVTLDQPDSVAAPIVLYGIAGLVFGAILSLASTFFWRGQLRTVEWIMANYGGKHD